MIVRNIGGIVHLFKKVDGLWLFRILPQPKGYKVTWTICSDSIVPEDIRNKFN